MSMEQMNAKYILSFMADKDFTKFLEGFLGDVRLFLGMKKAIVTKYASLLIINRFDNRSELSTYIAWEVVRSSFVGGQWRPGMVLGGRTSTVAMINVNVTGSEQTRLTVGELGLN